MKRSRFPFALALLLAVPFSLSACEGNKGVESSKDNQSSQEVSSRQESSHQESSSDEEVQSSESSQEQSQSESQLAFDISFNLEDITEEFDIHTEKQNGYLKDSYESISTYGSGTSENSKPNKLALSWTIEDCEEELTALRLNVYEASKDGKLIDRVSYPLDKDAISAEIDNLKLGTNYTWSITAIAGDKEVESRHSSISTKDGVARFINIDGLSNVRDCGGWTTTDGKKIKQGLLYRGEEFNKQNNGRAGSSAADYHYDPSKAKEDDPYGQKISDKGITTVVDVLKIQTEVDIRGYETFDWESRINYSPAECGGLVGELPDGSTDPENGVVGIVDEVNYVICPVHTNRDKLYYDNYGREACKNFFSMLADMDGRLPIYFHCAQGKDRTGFLATLFQALLGCSKEDILRDYLLSNLGKTGSVSISKITSNYNYVDYFLEGKEVTNAGNKDKAKGSTIAERAYNYLLDCGLTSEQLDTIRDTFLED